MAQSEYERGYDAALAEIYAALNSDEHPCGNCRACGVIRSVIEDTLLSLANVMTEEEFTTIAKIISRLGIRVWESQSNK